MKETIKACLHATDQEADLIIELFNLVKSLAPDVRMKFKENFIGIGNPSERFRFYFVLKKDAITVKFKYRSDTLFFNINDSEEYKKYVKINEEYFKEHDMTLNSKKEKEYKTFKINMSRSDFLITLSNGIDPITGEVLFAPSKDLSNAILSLTGFIIRKDKKDAKSFSVRDDIENIVDTLKSERTQFLESEDKSKWSIEEDNELLKEFRNSFPLETIAFRHNRTISSIKRRLLQLSSVSKSEDDD